MRPSTWIVLVLVLALGGLVAYFLTNPDSQRTERNTQRFDGASAVGAHFADAIRASPEFRTVTLGSCGRIDSSPDSGPKGSLIFSPVVGEFARYSSFDEFLARNPTLLTGHEECRTISVLYETIFPYRGQIDLEVDGRGIIRKKNSPVYFY